MKSKDKTVAPSVSVLILTYNQDLSRLIKTLDSIVIQEGITFEIILCDDGSKERYEEELRSYFSSKSFCQYSLVFHDQNEGTVSNYYSGLQIAKGKYTKLISPGDYLIENSTLFKWVHYLEEQKAEWSFSDAYYYKSDNDKMDYFRAKAMPQIIHPYIMNDRNRCIWNYTVLYDVANGAAILGTTHIQRHFCRIIKDKGIKYCEDFIYRIMMFYGNVGCYYPEPAISYEYGAGISTSGNSAWRERLAEDRRKLIQIMLDEKGKSDQQKRIVDAMIRNGQTGRIGKLFIRGKLLFWLKWHFLPRLTPIPKEVK